MQLDERAQPRLTEFGTKLYELMLSRGLRTFAELSRLLEKKGHHFSRQAIGTYCTGKRSCPAPFVEAVAEDLALDHDERRDLAVAFAYGQGSS